jgi:hypothetical protein
MTIRLSALLALVCLVVTISKGSVAGAIGGSVKDPKGAVIVGAQVRAIPVVTGETHTAVTDEQGRFRIDGLAPGTYKIEVDSPGFRLAKPVNVQVQEGRPVQIDLTMEVAGVKEEVAVEGKGTLRPNSETGYRSLRDGKPFESYSVEGLVLKRDVATVSLVRGSISFLPPVAGRVTMGVFVGEGEFSLVPTLATELDYLRRLTKQEMVREEFDKALFCFTDDSYNEIKAHSSVGGDPSHAAGVLNSFHDRIRLRGESNLEAETLADIYNPKYPGFFRAYIHGKKHNDLRFGVLPRGVGGFLGPEEVILTDHDRGSDEEGIWYLAHQEREYKNGTASSEEDKRTIDAEHYKIETVIDSGEKLTATAELGFTALVDGERLLHFGLLPALRVTRVSFADQDVNFIQEKEREDGSFNVILPAPLAKGGKYKITIEYQGHKVIEDAGGGNFAVGARTSWYPSVNAFNDRATFDLTFKVPRRYTVVGVGKPVKEWTEEGFAASQWVSDVPLAVAGFNYGLYKKKAITDPETKYTIEAYVTSDPPAYLRRAEELGSMSPAGLQDRAIVEAQNSVRIFSKYFGDAPYGRIAITQQPQFNFGQSWPTLVYLPVSAFLDSTQRYLAMGGINSRFTDFVYEVGSHEVSHQWWGHMVGWASYHDQWLSEGFASFSAGLYLQLTEKSPDKYLHYLDEARKNILEKNAFGLSANDAGPVWMGFRLSMPKVRQGYRNLVYPKGGYVLHMLRQIMYDNKSGDKQFIDMMHDFVTSRFNENASTESFKHIVEKHMTRAMDVDKNGKMDWFFNEWVYGSDVPSYRLEYSVEPDNNGKFLVKATLTQSGVSDSFVMPVPLYVEVDGKPFRLGEVTMVGNTSFPLKVRLDKKPKRVMINAYHDVLAREVVTKAN